MNVKRFQRTCLPAHGAGYWELEWGRVDRNTYQALEGEGVRSNDADHGNILQ